MIDGAVFNRGGAKLYGATRDAVIAFEIDDCVA